MQGLTLAMLASAFTEDEKTSKEYARRLVELLLPMPEDFETDIKLALANLLLEDKVRAPQYLDKALKAAGRISEGWGVSTRSRA